MSIAIKIHLIQICYTAYLYYLFLYVAEKYNTIGNTEQAEGLRESSLDDSLINLTGNKLIFIEQTKT